MKTPKTPSNVQARLVSVFSIFFAFCVLILSFFLYSVVSMVDYNRQASATFEANRQVYQLEAQFKQYELGLKHYEISASYQSEEELSALDRRIDENLAALALTLPEDSQPALETVSATKADLTRLVDDILATVDDQDELDADEQDWDAVAELDAQTTGPFTKIYASIAEIRSAGVSQLEDIRFGASVLGQLAFFSMIAAIFGFVVLAFTVSLIVSAQINLPMEQLASAARDLQARKFNPAEVQNLAPRNDEVGAMARDFLSMAASVEQRTAQLQQEADEIRAKIR